MKTTVGLLIPNSLATRKIMSIAQSAESEGFDQFWIPDERFYRDVYATLAVCAMSTSRISVGPCVTDPYSRHPALTASAIATLDELSNGRAMLGIGAGISGFSEMNLKREKPVLAIREAVDLIGQLHRGTEITYEGSTVSFTKGKLGLTPTQTRVPIYIASNGPLGQKMAAEMGEGVIMEACASVLEAQHFIKSIKAHASAAGRDGHVRCVARLNVAIGNNSASALDGVRIRAARTLSSGRVKFATLKDQNLELPEETRALVANVPYNAGPGPYAPICSAVTDEMVRAVALAGTAKEVCQQVEALMGTGITGLILSPVAVENQSVEDVVRLIAENILPAREQ